MVKKRQFYDKIMLKNGKNTEYPYYPTFFCATKTLSQLSDLLLPTEGSIFSISAQKRAVLSKNRSPVLEGFVHFTSQNGRVRVGRSEFLGFCQNQGTF